MNIHIIPAIDIIDGRCVRLTKGDYGTQKTYDALPLDLAKQYEDVGITRLHLVDLDGARSSHIVNLRTLELIATHTRLTIDFGGGIKAQQDLNDAFNAGAALVTIGSTAVKQPELFAEWLEEYGPDRIILGADAKDGKISVSGWMQTSELELQPFIDKHVAMGIRHVLCTDISRDGMLQGPATALYKEIMQRQPQLQLIASGGISSMDDIRQLDAAGIPAVVVGKALYEGRIQLSDLEDWTAKRLDV